mmetsp:Transcript_26379/g.81172  ORF Transcript_26379/g.81172 Transcript_26379/m.81172 type:complete len:290 (+) Transcript_26379:1303-2172(+)
MRDDLAVFESRRLGEVADGRETDVALYVHERSRAPRLVRLHVAFFEAHPTQPALLLQKLDGLEQKAQIDHRLVFYFFVGVRDEVFHDEVALPLGGARLVRRRLLVNVVRFEQGAVDFRQLAELFDSERRLTQSAAADDVHDAPRETAQGIQGLTLDICCREVLRFRREDSCTIESDVAVPYDDRPKSRGIAEKVVGQCCVSGVRVVPGDEAAGRQDARQVFAGDLERACRRRAARQDHGVVRAPQSLHAHVRADGDVADEAEVGRFRDAREVVLHDLDFGVVGRDAVTN